MYRLLFVDDEALIREGVSENVKWEKYGYELAGSCENGKEALAFIRNNPVDVVLTDICMPYLDGLQLSGKIFENYPEIKIIILSGYDEFEYAKKAIRYGVKEYLLKPITAVELGEALAGLKEELDREKREKRRYSEMKVNYHKGRQLLYSEALMNLIMGSKTEQESQKELAELGIKLEAAVYRVAVAELDIYAKTEKIGESVKKESALMAFVLHNISQELVKQYDAGEVCQGRDQRTFIIFRSNKPAEMRQRIKNICEAIIHQMNQAMQLSVNIGIGSYVHHIKDIYISSEEAEEALEYHYVLGGNRVLEMDAIRERKGQADLNGIIDRIHIHIKENDAKKLKEDFQLLEEVMRDNMYDRQSIGTVFVRIADMAEELDLLGDTEAVHRGEKGQVVKEVLSAGDIKRASEILLHYCTKAGEGLESGKNVGGRKYAVLAMDYIERNYGDCSLSIHSICSYLNISASRFSSIFKTVTGTTFMDILSSRRMQKAKELLAHTDLKNYEIAERVGFNDPHYFSIAFKKATGKTPTEYTKEMRQ